MFIFDLLQLSIILDIFHLPLTIEYQIFGGHHICDHMDCCIFATFQYWLPSILPSSPSYIENISHLLILTSWQLARLPLSHRAATGRQSTCAHFCSWHTFGIHLYSLHIFCFHLVFCIYAFHFVADLSCHVSFEITNSCCFTIIWHVLGSFKKINYLFGCCPFVSPPYQTRPYLFSSKVKHYFGRF